MTDATTPTVVSGDLPQDLASAFQNSGRIAWDVETSGLDWRRDRLALCQIYSPHVGVAIVKIDQRASPRMAALLSDPGVETVFHHAPFDLKFMTHLWKVPAAAVRCTKVASKLVAPAALNSEHSLAALADRHLGVRLEKGAVRTSDWETTNLSPEQLQYAVRDVLYLLPLLDALEKQLADIGRRELYDDCCQFIPTRVQLELLDSPDVFAY